MGVSRVFVDRPDLQARPAWGDVGQVSRYDIASGSLSDLRTAGNTAAATCSIDDIVGTGWSDDSLGDPLPGEGLYYVIRGQNACGTGSYDAEDDGTSRQPTVDCPGVVVPGPLVLRVLLIGIGIEVPRRTRQAQKSPARFRRSGGWPVWRPGQPR